MSRCANLSEMFAIVYQSAEGVKELLYFGVGCISFSHVLEVMSVADSMELFTLPLFEDCHHLLNGCWSMAFPLVVEECHKLIGHHLFRGCEELPYRDFERLRNLNKFCFGGIL